MRINDDGQTIQLGSYTNHWTSTNSTMVLTANNFLVDTRYVLEINPSSINPIVLTLPNTELYLDDNGLLLSANLRIKSLSTCSTSTKIFIDSNSGSVEPFGQSFSSGQYNAIQSNTVTVPDDDQIHNTTIEVTITGHNAKTIYITCPHVIREFAFYANPIVNEFRRFLPDFYWEIDSEKTEPSYPFFRLIDILSSTMGDVLNEYSLMYGLESSQLITKDEAIENYAKSSLVSSNVVRSDYVPWLSQFTGSYILNNLQLKDGSFYFDNHQLERDFIEWQLSNSYYGRASGTREAISRAAQIVLIKTKNGGQSTKSVAITPNFGGNPFALKIQTLTNETIDASDGESSYVVLKSVEHARPMGYTVEHVAVDEFNLTLDDITLGVLDGTLTYA